MSVFEKLLTAIDSGAVDTLLEPFEFSTSRQNQMLFFIKPEVFLLPRESMERVCGLIQDRLSAFGMEIEGGYLMSAETLDARRIMDRHYGYINQVSRTASVSLSDADKSEVRRLCAVNEDAPIRGGHEVLREHSSYSARSLDELWASKKSQRLRSGLYVEAFEFGGTKTVVANGFHPYQLEHFTGSGRKICLLLLNSDLPWSMLRAKMLGDTFPEKAVPGSIRGELNRDSSGYGFADVTIANNCAHMSAGAFEAVFELSNFLSGVEGFAFAAKNVRQADHFKSFGLGEDDLERAIGNPTAMMSTGYRSSLFDQTEECDALSATATYRQFYSEI